MNILLIEDNIDHTEIIIDILNEAYPKGITVTTTTSFIDGLDKLENHVFELCLCDLKLPDSPLQNTIDTLSKTTFSAPIIVLTSINNDAIAIDLIKAGIQDYIAKDKLDTEYLSKQCSFAIERKAMEQALVDKTTDYEAFCHSLSHDFNSALRRIKQCTHFLTDSLNNHYTLTPQETQWLGYIETSASDVQRLTHDLYEYMNAENHFIEEPFVNLADLIKKIMIEYKDKIELVQCQLPIIKGNPAQLELTFKNMIENSIKYSTNPPKISFSYKIDEYKSSAFIHIDDNGIGIPKSKAKDIFLPFKRLENTLEAQGSGLGLSLVHRVIKHLHGSISVEPSILGGSCFKIKLPYSRLQNSVNNLS